MMNIKQLFFSCLAIAFCACQSDQESFSLPEEKPIETLQKAYWVSPNEAKQALEEIISFGSFKTRSSATGERTIEEVIDLSSLPATRSASAFTKRVGEDFYVVTFANNQGYALVSKDKRTFPVFAILDEGAFSIEELENNEMLRAQVSLQQAGKEKEIQAFEDSLARHKVTRSSGDYVDVIGDTSAFDQLYSQGWKFIRSVPPRLETCWGQWTNEPLLYLKKEGASYADVYGNLPTRSIFPTIIDKEFVGKFGCTPVAYAQVMYALRNCEGFKELTYTNGEKYFGIE